MQISYLVGIRMYTGVQTPVTKSSIIYIYIPVCARSLGQQQQQLFECKNSSENVRMVRMCERREAVEALRTLGPSSPVSKYLQYIYRQGVENGRNTAARQQLEPWGNTSKVYRA